MKRQDFWNGIPILDDDTPPDALFAHARGYDESQVVPEMFDAPAGMELIPPSQYDGWIEMQEQTRSSLEHLYLAAGWDNLDQNPEGYCWAYSTAHCVMILRVRDHQPYVRLSPHAVAAIIKGGRDEGGWCGLSAKFLREVGIPSEAFWPAKSRNLANDTPEMRANAALHRTVEDWYDLARPVHGQVLTERQVDTCLLTNIPCALDFNWWGHSVCGLRLVKVEGGSYGRLILNSWPNWGRRGLAVLRGSRAVPNGAVALRVTTASPV